MIPPPSYNRGFTYAELQNRQQAIKDFTHTIQLQPDNAEVYYNRGRAKYE